MSFLRRAIFIASLLPFALVQAQSGTTSPLKEFGHNIGDDYFLANYQQLLNKLLAKDPIHRLASASALLAKIEELR